MSNLLIAMAICKKGNKLGITVIDELRLCFTAEPSLLETLRRCNIAECLDFCEFYMVRVDSRYFYATFHICSCDEQQQIATLNFDKIGDNVSNYVWLRPENWVLYDNDMLKYTLSTISNTFSLQFNNFTVIDLAKDFSMNVANLIRKLYKNKELTTIINGKAIRDRKKVIPEFHIAHSVSLDRLTRPTLYVKQKAATHDKTKGICVQSYNKKAEIESESGKDYILNFYNNPKFLHRLEVHLNAPEIRDYCKSRRIRQSIDMIFDKEVLTDMFYYHLAAVIRFTKGRQKLQWKDLLRCNGSTI